MKLSNSFLFAGSSHPSLANEIALQAKIPLGKLSLKQFPDGEISVQILENVRGRDVFVLQSVALDPNFYLMELLIIIDALKRASAKNIVAVIPYFGYCRQDRKDKPHVPITAKLVANMLMEAGAHRIVTMDLHAGQLEGFFDIPVDHILCQKLLVDAFRNFGLHNCVVVAPDIGSVKTGRVFANLLDVELAIMDKQRFNSHAVEMLLIGNVQGKNVLIVDDMCSTGGTLVAAAQLCKEKGCERIFTAVTHGICLDNVSAKIENSLIESFLLTNTIPFTDRLSKSTKFKMISVAPLLIRVIRQVAR